MQVRIVSDGTPRGTKVFTESGAAIGGLTDVVFRAGLGDINRAELSLSVVQIEADASARTFVGGREVRRIEFADGTVEDYPAS